MRNETQCGSDMAHSFSCVGILCGGNVDWIPSRYVHV